MTFVEEDDIKFYLIDYRLLAPSWGLSVIYLKKIILHLSGSIPKNTSTNLKYPLVRYTKKDEYKRWKSYYAFEKGTMKTLIAWESISPKRKVYIEEFIEMTGLLGTEIQTKKITDKNYQKIPVNPNALLIFKTLLKIKENGKQLFVNHELPTDDHHYTSTIFGAFQNAMLAIYEGRFLTKYSMEKMDERFIYKHKYYLNNEKIKEAIKYCKGDWNKITEVILNAANNYSKWFNVDTEQSNKDYLPRSISTWIYEPHTKQSYFYVSLLIPPSSAREADADKMYNSISLKVRTIFNPIYQNEWDGFTFWNKINNLVKWYYEYAEELLQADSNVSYWFNGLLDFLDNYKTWLLEFSEKPFLKNIGIGNPTFDLYIKQKKQEHGIEVNIPRSL